MLTLAVILWVDRFLGANDWSLVGALIRTPGEQGEVKQYTLCTVLWLATLLGTGT